MALPNPGMSFSPLTELPAAELNDIVENVEALSAGTGLATGAVTTAKLADASVTNAKLATGAGEPGGAWTSWTPTIVGFSAVPAGGIYLYKRIGNTVFINIRQPTIGTSNATTFTISLPFTAATTTDQSWETNCRGVNNGSLLGERYATISSGGTVVSFASDAAGAVWVSSGGKRVVAVQMFYEAA